LTYRRIELDDEKLEFAPVTDDTEANRLALAMYNRGSGKIMWARKAAIDRATVAKRAEIARRTPDGQEPRGLTPDEKRKAKEEGNKWDNVQEALKAIDSDEKHKEVTAYVRRVRYYEKLVEDCLKRARKQR
jgi:hypothetical protein